MGQESHGVEQGGPPGEPSAEGGHPDEAVERLEQRAEAIRGNLDALVDEVERRGSRLVTPLAVGAGVAGLVVLVVGGAAAWRRLRRRQSPSRLRGLAGALRRAMEHPERVAEGQPSWAKKVLASGGAAVASLAVHQLARMASAKLTRPSESP